MSSTIAHESHAILTHSMARPCIWRICTNFQSNTATLLADAHASVLVSLIFFLFFFCLPFAVVAARLPVPPVGINMHNNGDREIGCGRAARREIQVI